MFTECWVPLEAISMPFHVSNEKGFFLNHTITILQVWRYAITIRPFGEVPL